jgi:hypothetical protein
VVYGCVGLAVWEQLLRLEEQKQSGKEGNNCLVTSYVKKYLANVKLCDVTTKWCVNVSQPLKLKFKKKHILYTQLYQTFYIVGYGRIVMNDNHRKTHI